MTIITIIILLFAINALIVTVGVCAILETKGDWYRLLLLIALAFGISIINFPLILEFVK